MAAWPRWVESYGVMPHTYMRTTGPTSNGTTARCAVSKMLDRHVAAAEPTPSMRSEPFALVPEVDGEQGRGEGLDADRVRERAGVEGPQVGDGVDEVEHGRATFVVADDEDVAGERVAEVGERGGRDEVEGGDDVRAPGATAFTSAAIEPAGDGTGRELAAPFSRPLAIEITILPASWSAWARAVDTAASQTVARTTRSASAASWLVPGSRPATRSPQRSRSSSTTCGRPFPVP